MHIEQASERARDRERARAKEKEIAEYNGKRKSEQDNCDCLLVRETHKA